MPAQFIEGTLQAISVAADDLDTDGITSEEAIRKFFGNDGQLGSACGEDAVNLRRLSDAKAIEDAANERFYALWRIADFVQLELRIVRWLFHATTMRSMASISQGEFSGSLAYAYAWEWWQPPYCGTYRCRNLRKIHRVEGITTVDDNAIEQYLTPEHISGIGSLVVAMSRVESILVDLIAAFMECDVVSALVAVYHQSMSAKISTLRTLMNLRFGDEDDLKPIFDPLNEAERLSVERNTVVHCLWRLDDEGNPEAVRFQAKGKFKRNRNSYPIEKVLRMVDDAKALERELLRMRKHFPAKVIIPET